LTAGAAAVAARVGGKAEIRIATGGGKTYLSRVIRERYAGAENSASTGLTADKILNIDLNSSEAERSALFNSTGRLDSNLVMLDEAFFYGDYFLADMPESDRERERNDIIRKLRDRGATVIIFGASESLSKIEIEIERQEEKEKERKLELEELFDGIRNLNYERADLEYAKNAIATFIRDYSKRTSAKSWSGAERSKEKEQLRERIKSIAELPVFTPAVR
jgi:hypothetical protein